MNGSTNPVDCMCGYEKCEHRAVANLLIRIDSEGKDPLLSGPESLCIPCLLTCLEAPELMVPPYLRDFIEDGSQMLVYVTPIEGTSLFLLDPRVIAYNQSKKEALNRHRNN